MPLGYVHIKNFKSIKDSGRIDLSPINVFIGPNGAGKSNFLGFFKLLNAIYNERLQFHVAKTGNVDKFLYFGRKRSPSFSGTVVLNDSLNKPRTGYNFKLSPNQNNRLFFEIEAGGEFDAFQKASEEKWKYTSATFSEQEESQMRNHGSGPFHQLGEYFKDFRVFHFHDTSSGSPLKQANRTHDYQYLKEDGANLAAILYKLQEAHPDYFKMIEYSIRSVAPFFERFQLQPDQINPEYISLNWFQKGSEEYFNAHDFSDGTLRFIALTTLLLQPDPPKVIIIDEPELGLHPSAIDILASMIKSASTKSQIIIATHSIGLLNHFETSDIIVVDVNNEQTVFKRQNAKSLAAWLKSYSMGELWEKNVLGGTP